jgi:hypothetical protein
MPEEGARSICIRCDVDRAMNFLGDVETLPLWACFYKERLGRQAGAVRFTTPIGESLTRIETNWVDDVGRVTIISDFGLRVEQAVMLVEPIDVGCRVTFLITFPDHVPPQRRRIMLGQLEWELLRLRTHLQKQRVLEPVS